MKITYLLGAGASEQALPIVRNLSDSILSLNRRLNSLLVDSSHPTELSQFVPDAINNKVFVRKIIDELNLLSQKNEEFNTIDTYAKYLYLTEDPYLNKLKKYISIYFILHQLIFHKYIHHNDQGPFIKLDKRYLSFIVSAMSNKAFPTDIKILTWNYDFQIEIAGEYFRNEKFEYTENNVTYHLPLINYWPRIGKLEIIDIPKYYQIYHLNGIAGLNFLNSNQNFVNSIFDLSKNIEYEREIFTNIQNFINDGQLLFHFAWEKSELFEDISDEEAKQDLIHHLNESEIMVIIGYSFPFFNRLIDKQIFENFLQFSNSKKIYYQNINNDSEKLYEQFNFTKSTADIKFVGHTNNFFIPHDF